MDVREKLVELLCEAQYQGNAGRYVEKAWYDGDGFIDENYVDITCDVTHWMPLPQPPKGK